MTLDTLTPDAIISAYSGRGCPGCGCRGKWRYTSAHQALGGTKRGYPVAQAEVSDRFVARALSNARKSAGTVKVSLDGSTLSVETSDRLYIFTTTSGAR